MTLFDGPMIYHDHATQIDPSFIKVHIGPSSEYTILARSGSVRDTLEIRFFFETLFCIMEFSYYFDNLLYDAGFDTLRHFQ